MKLLATYNFKGGVGKTATAVNVAYMAAADGAPTLVWDLDPQGAATFTFRIRPKVKGGSKRVLRGELDGAIRATDFDGLDLLPADFSYRTLDVRLNGSRDPAELLGECLHPLRKSYELVVLDCAPSISATAEGVFGVVDALLAPTIPTPLSLRTLAKLLQHLKGRERRPLVLPFFCMVDKRKKLHREVCAYARREELGFLETEIPYSSAVERMGIERRPLGTFAAGDKAAVAYRSLWEEIRGRLDEAKPRGARRKGVKTLLASLPRPRGH